jgi:hypothetical protein
MIRTSWKLITVFILIAVLAGCTRGSYHIQRGSVDFAQQSASGAYSLFDGYKERILSFEAGDELEVSFSSQTRDGSIQAQILTDEEQELVTLDSDDLQRIVIPEDGRYRIRIEAEDHSGAFSLMWAIQ